MDDDDDDGIRIYDMGWIVLILKNKPLNYL